MSDDDTRWTDHHRHAQPIPRQALEQFAQDLGYDPADVLSITVDPDRVQVMTIDREQHGHRFVNRHEVR